MQDSRPLWTCAEASGYLNSHQWNAYFVAIGNQSGKSLKNMKAKFSPETNVFNWNKCLGCSQMPKPNIFFWRWACFHIIHTSHDLLTKQDLIFNKSWFYLALLFYLLLKIKWETFHYEIVYCLLTLNFRIRTFTYTNFFFLRYFKVLLLFCLALAYSLSDPHIFSWRFPVPV